MPADTWAARFLASGHDLGHVVGLAAGVPLPVEPNPGVGQLALLPAQVLPGAAYRPLRRLLFDGERSDEAAQVPAVDTGGSDANLDDLVDEFQQLAVVADHDDRTDPAAYGRGQSPRAWPVEVVRRLVQDQRVRPCEEETSQRGEHRLAAGECADPGVEIEVGQTQLGQRRRDALRRSQYVEQIQVLWTRLAGIGPGQRGQPVGDPEQLRDRSVDVERQLLGQVTDQGGPDDLTGGRGARRSRSAAGGLALAVAPDQAGEPVREGEVQVGEDDVAIGPGGSQGG